MLAELLSLARECGLEVRVLGAAAGGTAREGETPPSSGVCRVRGAVWVMVSRQDPVDAQCELLAGALREHAASELDGRWLPPAIRALLALDADA